MDEAFIAHLRTKGIVKIGLNSLGVITNLTREGSCSLGYNDIELMWETWQAAQAVPAQLDVNSILHDIDCYFDNGLSNTERTANNLLQSIYEKLSGEVKAQEPAND